MSDTIKSLLLFIATIAIGYCMVLGIGYFDYKIIGKIRKEGVLYLPTGSSLNEQIKILYSEGFLRDTTESTSLANKIRKSPFQGGKYTLKKGMTYSELFSMLGGGNQTPTKIIFNNVYDKASLAGKIARTIELDSASLVAALSNDTLLSRFGVTSDEIIFRFMPNTYEVYWNIMPDRLIEMMITEYNAFWSSGDREAKLKSLKMTREEVMTLASIVGEESNIESDMRLIAGVYINRLRRGMLLQADPTVRFAHGDRSIKRVLDRHLEIDSPYNTYKYKGLPPNPISIPSMMAIDAVLNYTPSGYLYFCASDKLDGTHIFTRSFKEHIYNARKYARKLNELYK